jgi:nucleoside phosphorylase
LCADLGCNESHLVARERLKRKQDDGSVAAHEPAVYVRVVGSADTVMKSAADRDRLARKEGIIAFEMEGAGVWDEVPCIVVKGVCDYADSHKHKGWQNFAAATAAAAVKAILTSYTQIDRTATVSASSKQ